MSTLTHLARRSVTWLAALLAFTLAGCAGTPPHPTGATPPAAPDPGLVDVLPAPRPVRSASRIAERPQSQPGRARVPAPTATQAVRVFAERLLGLPTQPRAAHRALGALIDRSRGRARRDAEQARAVGLRGRQHPARVVAIATGSDDGYYVVAQTGAGARARHELYRARARRQRGGWAVVSWEQIR